MNVEILENELVWLESIGCEIIYEKDGILVTSSYDNSTDFNFFISFNPNRQKSGCYRISDKDISSNQWIKMCYFEECYDINYVYQARKNQAKKLLYTFVEVDYKSWKKERERKRKPCQFAHYFDIFEANIKIGRFSTVEDKIIGLYDYELKPEYRNKGIGSLVLKNICNKYDNMVFIQTWSKNVSAMKCYEKAGFVKCEILYRYNMN